MKKTISALLALMMLLSMLPTFAFAAESNASNNVTLGEIQQELIDYVNNTGAELEPGTDTYYNYIVDQLLNQTDKELREHPNYNLIHAYMVEYKVAYEDYLFCREITEDSRNDIINTVNCSNTCVRSNDITGEISFELSPLFLSKTIADIICENQVAVETNNLNGQATKASGYSGSRAAAYAIKYADSHNSSYPHYSADCANFVSQCVYAGGLSMSGSSSTVGTVESTSNWYCLYINSILGIRRYAVTTSWVRVSDFNTYFSSVGTKTTKTTISALVSSCATGDPVQLADKTTGTPYHTIIISDKDSSTAYFCGHTNSRNNVDVYDYLDQSVDKFILFDIT